MGKIKKLKNNELVGGVDKEDVYPITSTKAVFDDNNTSQDDINKNRLDRIEELEETMPTTVKSITINGSTKAYFPKDGNVELTIYSEGGEDYPGIAEAVQTNADNITAIQNEIGTDTTENTLSGRIKSLENAVGSGGSVAQRIEDAINDLDSERTVSTTHLNAGIRIVDGKVSGFDIVENDIASAADLAVLTSGIEGLKGPNVVIIPDHLNVSNPQINTIYREQGENTTYKDWSYANGTWYPMATYDIGNLDPLVSYYICTTPAATPAKTATGTDASAYALTLGGHFKVEMAEANTAPSGVTLQVGSAAAKELMYNGTTVNATNTWEAREVIAVYYYNNKYWASNAQGGSNKNINTYLYGDLRALAVGQTYYLGESIKTENKQLLKITKDILKMNVFDEVSIGDIRVVTSGTYLGTYQALKNVKTYTDTSYAENDYAIGRPAGAVINVTVDSETISSLEEATPITVTIAGILLTVTIDSTMDAAGVATAIFTTFGTQEEWKLTDNGNGTLTLISKVVKTSAPTISSSVGDTGITISFAENSAYAGNIRLSKYNGTTWGAVSVDNYAADTAMWASRDVTWLSTISNDVVKLNSVQNEFNTREDTSEYWDFAISDKKGNVICIIKDGHIITKNFKSSDLTISVGDVANAAYAVSDANGNMAFAITEDGHIVTKNFNSRLVSLESIALLDKIITLVTKFIGKTMAVVGDSISTYQGYTPSDWRVYYNNSNLGSVTSTFWYQVANTLGMTALNCAYSASAVAGDSTQTQVSASHAQGECAGCSDVRIASLTRDGNTPDIVLITLGTNDYGSGRALGSWDEHSAIPSEGTISNFSSAYALMLHKIKTALPNARIFCCTIFQRSFNFPTGTLSIRSYNDVIKKMADIFGCDVIDTYACGLNRYNIGSYTVDGTLHPNAAGHKLIADKIITELIAKY